VEQDADKVEWEWVWDVENRMGKEKMTQIAATKQRFEVDGRCMACQFKTFEKLLNAHQVDYRKRQEFFGFFNLTMGRKYHLTMPEIHSELNDEFCRITGLTDIYSAEKQVSNEIALELYEQLKPQVLISSDPFNRALRLAIAGNIMDYGVSADFDIHKTIEKVLTADFAIDHSILLKQQIQQAKKIVYLGDNAGEIVFDKLLIELMIHPNVIFVVRGSAVLNDATREDAHSVGMDVVADVIDNGSKVPSTVLSTCSPEFVKHYNEADLIISKGQGNFEGLIDENDPRIFFLLTVKCDVVAELIGVEKGSFVVFNQINYTSENKKNDYSHS
jgi:damage-control phosphatase, subfamily I